MISMEEKGHFLCSSSVHFCLLSLGVGSLQQSSKYPESGCKCKQVIVCDLAFKL